MKAPSGPEFNFPQQPPLPPQVASEPQKAKTEEEIKKEEYQKMIDEMYKGNDNSEQYETHR